MKILAVDDETLMLAALTDSIRKAAPAAELVSFRSPLEALQYAQRNAVDVAFLDIRMRGMDGLELGKQLLELHPALNLIFCTGYDEHISEAFRRIRCNGYITKPVDAEQIAEELAHLRAPIPIVQAERRVRFQCMGRFEVFVDEKPVSFGNMKTKELLACLVHACGGICGNQEIIACLWDDDNRHDSYYKKIRKDLIETLTACGCADILVRQRAGMGIDVSAVECDYYHWRKSNAGVLPSEYMTQYPWAKIPYYER